MKNKKLEKLYAKGEISIEEYNNKLSERKHKPKKPNLDFKLAQKLDREYAEFCEKLLARDKKVIFDKAYEKVVKEEMKEELKNMDLHDKEKQIMIAQDDLLNEFYHDWLVVDIPLGEPLRYSLEESIATLTRYKGVEDIESDQKIKQDKER